MLNILVLGGGGMGRKHIASLLATDRCEVCCVDPDPRSHASIRTRYPEVTCIPDREALRPDALDGVVVATPTQLHVEHALWCIAHRLPVLLEKPLSVDEDGIPELCNAVAAAGVTTGVAFPRRSSPAYQELQRRVDAGSLGALKMISTAFCQDFRKYRPDYREIYYARLATGGGLLADALSHHVNLVTAFAGEVASVTALADRLVLEGCEGEDTAILALSFRNGSLGCIQGNQFQKPNVDAIELVGTAGNLRYERVSGTLAFSADDSGSWETVALDGDYAVALRAQAEEFLDAIEGRGPIRTSIADAWHTLRVVRAARESVQRRSAVCINEIEK